MKKKCNNCGEEKEEEKFVKHSGKYRNQCKECKNKFKREKNAALGKNPHRFPKGHVPWIKGRKDIVAWNKGKKSKPESVLKLRMSLAKRGKGRWCLNAKLWREKVLDRDGHKCVQCDSTTRLHCHHIIPWKEDDSLRFEVSNGMTLCQSCHMVLEKTGFKYSEESKKKMSLSRIGTEPWNKGKIKELPKEKVCKDCGEMKKADRYKKTGYWLRNYCRQCEKKRNES